MQKNSSTFKRLLDNFLSLSALQMVNYIVPLLTFPYLVRVLGVEDFGLFSFVMAVIGYGIIITDYGFDLSATKHISTNSDNPQKINEIFSSVMVIKSAMAILFFLFLLLLVGFVEKFSSHAMLYIYGFGMVLGQVLFPVWFFQGIEKMRYITILNALSKAIFAAAIFIFVKSKEDLELVFVFNALGALIAGALAFNIAVKKFGVRFSLQSKEKYLFYLKDAWYIFTSRVAVQLYQSLNLIILGFLVSNTLLGYYAIVEKIVRAGGAILVALPRALYPYMAKLHQSSIALFYQRNLYLALGLLAIMIPVAGGVYYLAPEILSLVSGKEHPPAIMIKLLQMLSPLFAVVIFGNLFTNILVILNETKLMNKVVVTAGLLNLALVYPTIKYFSVEGLAWLNLFIAMCVIVMTKGYFIFYHFKKRDVPKHKPS